MAVTSTAPLAPKSAAPWQKALRRASRDFRTMLGFVIVVVVITLALFAPLLAPYGPETPDFANVLQSPSSAHLFGTDELGRDVFSRIIWGARVSLLVGVISVGAALMLGTVIGVMAGYFGHSWDAVLMRLMDIIFAFPSILLALAITAVLGPSLVNAMLAIAVVYVPTFARLARGQVLTVRELTYVEASRALGVGDGNIMARHIVPNILAPLIIQSSLLFASAIITESYLSFLGLGIQPPTPSWGNMLKNAIGFLELAPWMAWFPGLAIFFVVIGFNLLGDGLRDLFDPRSR
jgi:peptide/nickel transport system permease protein